MSSIRLYEGEFNQRIHAYTSNGKSKSLSSSTRVYFKIKIASTLWRKGISEKLDPILLLQQRKFEKMANGLYKFPFVNRKVFKLILRSHVILICDLSLAFSEASLYSGLCSEWYLANHHSVFTWSFDIV